jgi:hypothetical protein
MKIVFYSLLTIGLLCGAYLTAQNKINEPVHFQDLKLGMTRAELEKIYGSPSSIERNHFIYIFSDGSELFVTLRDGKVSSAQLKFHKAIQIEDPEMDQLTLVQMDSLNPETNSSSWFYAGKPEEGMIYKITSEGVVESLTWVPPFTYGTQEAKHIGALLKDFKSQKRL